MSKNDQDAVIIKASFDMKIKAGSGGFDRDAIVRAEKILADAANIFPDVAKPELDMIEDALRMIEDESKRAAGNKKLLAACVELRAHSGMFQYPLVGMIADKLLQFCLELKTVTPTAAQVIIQFLHAFRLSIDEGPRAITPHDKDVLLHDLDIATKKVLSKQA